MKGLPSARICTDVCSTIAERPGSAESDIRLRFFYLGTQPQLEQTSGEIGTVHTATNLNAVSIHYHWYWIRIDSRELSLKNDVGGSVMSPHFPHLYVPVLLIQGPEFANKHVSAGQHWAIRQTQMAEDGAD